MITSSSASTRPTSTRPTGARPLGALALAVALVASSGCSVLTPATDADQSGISNDESTTSAGSGNGQDSSGNTSTTDATDTTDTTTSTTTAELADPIWQQLQLVLTPIAQLDAPIAFASRSGSLNYYVAERAGRVRVIEREISDRGRESISVARQPLLDISAEVSLESEQGLLGIVFSSDGRHLYASHTDLEGTLVITEFPVARNDRADMTARRELLRVPQPAANHNGGSLALGPDGFLYIGLGDGGGAGDPNGNGQNTETLLGSVVRIDPFASGERPYTIPDGNPFAQGGGAPEIWLWGVRNPWRLSFDSETGDLWIADVGQDEVEEVDLLTAADGGGRAANLGWNEMEGDRAFEGGSPPDGYVAPLFTYGHEAGRCSVIGGHIYRGEGIALLDGVYVFGDYCTGEILGLQVQPDGVVVRPLTVRSGDNRLVSFGEGPDGEILVLELTGPDGLGTVSRIDPKEVASTDE